MSYQDECEEIENDLYDENLIELNHFNIRPSDIISSKGHAPVNYSDTQLASAERSVQQAYERYVLAQFQFQDQNEIDSYKKKAIESLIPGTIHHYHLFFLDLLKQKKSISEFSNEEKEHFEKFNKKFGNTSQFYEIETRLKFLNQIENMSEINEKTSKEDIDKFIDVLQYIEQYFQNQTILTSQKPDYLNQNYNGESSQSENEDAADGQKISKTQVFDYDKFFYRSEDVKKAQKQLDNFIDEKKIQNLDPSLISGFENEIDWSKVYPEFAYQYAQSMSYSYTPQSVKIFEMINESFFEKICDHFKQKYEKYQQSKKKQDKFQVDENFFESFTLQQLDNIRNSLTKKGIEIKDKEFFKSYFSKVFSDELSAENQELLNNEEKLNNLITLYNYAKSKKFSKGLCSTLLHEILTLSIKCDDYKDDLFIDYLQNPVEKNYEFKQKSAIQYNQKAKEKRVAWNSCLQNVQSQQSKQRFQNWESVDNQNDVIPKYLHHICVKNNGKLMEKFQVYFNEQYLKQIERKVQVYQTDRGLIELEDDFDHQEYKRIQDEVILRFKETNKEIFKVDEQIVLQLEIKNVPELSIKIYEFNTETYYKKNLQPFDSSIDLQGLEPSYQRIERERFQNTKKNKILTEKFEFNELNGKIGLFIIELQGNGYMSRAVIKKGSLSLIHRSTANGHMAFIIDADRKICKSEGTGVWIEKKFYPCNQEKNGTIFIPYISDGPRSTKLIMIHQGFAQLGEFLINTETYELDLYFHINSESILVGQEAHILVRPLLSINGRKTSVKQLKNTKIELTILDFNNIPTKLTFNDQKFNNDQETILQFQVPLNCSQISIEMQAQVQNATIKKLQDFKTPKKTIIIHEHKGSYQLKELYLRKIGKNYFVYCLGRNGEPLTNGTIKLIVKNKDKLKTVEQDLQIDKLGRVGLGELKDIESVSAQIRAPDYINETWQINQVQGDIWTIPDQMDIIEGESIEIPVNFPEGQQLERYQASLVMNRDGKLIKNMFERIKLIKSESGASYQMIQLKDLENGEYILKLKMSASQLRTIEITVHKGQYWEGNFILKKNCLLESFARKNAIRLEQIQLRQIGGSQNESELKIYLTNFSDKTRIHLYSMQFVPNQSNSLWKEIEKYSKDKFSMTKFPFAKWQNMFDSEQVMSDEIRYVFKRKQKESMMGNVLERPSLLVKRQFVQNTQTDNERLKAGTQFQKRENLNDYDKGAIMKKEAASISMKRKKKAHYSKNSFQECDDLLSQSRTQDSSNKVKDYQNFLSCAPIQIFNLKPNEYGIATANLQDIQNFSQIFVIACDDNSVCQRELSVNELQENLQKENDIPKRDLSQNKKIEDTGLIEQRQALPLEKDQQIHIEDITSSKVQIIDTLNKLHQVVEISWVSDGISYEEKIKQLVQENLLVWEQLDFNKKLNQYSNFSSHELNLFIFKKDQEFFNQVVLEKILTKMEKTFVDWYLLSQDINKSYQKYYLDKLLKIIDNHNNLQELNILEICLLTEICFKFGNDSHKQKAKQFSKIQIEEGNNQRKANLKEKYYIDREIKIFEVILGLNDLDKDNKLNLEEQAGKFKEFEAGGFDSTLQSQCIAECAQVNDDNFADIFGMRGANQQQNQMQSMQNAMPRSQMIQSRAQMVQNCMPMSQNIQPGGFGSFAPQMMMAKQFQAKPQHRDLFRAASSGSDEEEEERYHYQEKKKALNNVNFQEVEKTAEYMETHYYNYAWSGPFKSRFNENPFYVAYLQHLIDSHDQGQLQKQFLTQNFTNIQAVDLPILLVLIDLPHEKQQSHKFKSDGKRGIFITLNSNSIVFKKEIKEGECKIKNDLMITQRYTSLLNAGTEEELEDFIVNHPYQCEVIMTNVSSKHKQVTLLMQIPNGSLPVMKSKYIESKNVMINPFYTIKETVQFYFPKDGKFQHYPSNISENGIVVSKAQIKEFDVGKKQVIKKVQTFRHLMMTQSNDEARKNRIIQLITNELEKIVDPNFQFNDYNEIQYYLQSDIDFALQFIEIIDKQMIFNYEFSKYIGYHLKSFLNDQKYANKRELIFKYYKLILENSKDLYSYILKPVNNQIIEVQNHSIFDIKYKHLEYFPMVNSRVFSVGGQDNQDEKDQNSHNKEILNVQFRQTYYKFLHCALHQDNSQDAERLNELNLNSKQRLQLVYFLQLQDRIDEAINVFKTIDVKEIQNGGEHDVTCQIVYDYMRAYFDFYNDQNNQEEESSSLIQRFQVAREIVQKYEKCNILNFKNAFKKIKEQLNELDQGHSANQNEQIEINQSEQISDEQKRIALEQSKNKQPSIHEIKLDQNTGELNIDSVNIEYFTIKYYLIDTEILFSRSPFVQNQAERFSYVKPFFEQKQQTKTGQNTNIPLPSELKGKNVVIEIDSHDIQEFKTFYSSQMLVQCNENYGELRVQHKVSKKPLSKVYVKVFCKNNSGQDVFFRDGFTDIRGKFEYACASGKSLADVQKFAIFVDHQDLGSLIKEVGKPKKQ